MRAQYHPFPMKIPCAPESEQRQVVQPGVVQPAAKTAMLRPFNAWRILNRLTHGSVSRATFYRWLSNGKVFSFRLGYRIYVPMAEIEDVAAQVRNGTWWS